VQRFLKLKFKRITNSLKRKRLANRMSIKISVIIGEKIPKLSIFGLSFFLFWSFLGFSQTKETDSVWIPIYKKDSNKVSYKIEGANYNELYYRSIQVPIYDSIDEGYVLSPLKQDIESLLKQTQLDNSYSVSEVKGTELENSLRLVEKFSYPFASSITSQLAEKLNLRTNNPVLVAKDDELHELTILDNTLLSTKTMLNLIHENAAIELDQRAYLRFRLLSFLIGSTNLSPDQYLWKSTDNSKQTIVPYISSYQNEYMNFDGSYKLIAKLVS